MGKKPEKQMKAEKTEKQPETGAAGPLNAEAVEKAIALGKDLTKAGKSKADITREIYPLIKKESRETIVEVFIKSAALTEKGAMTYFYNMKRKAS